MKKTVFMNMIDQSYHCLFDDDWSITAPGVVYTDQKPDLLLLVGHHTDVDPALYCQPKSPDLHAVNRAADDYAMWLIHQARCHDIPVIGICKGAQQVCVGHGGTLIQHVPTVGTHEISADYGLEGQRFEVPADHHQVMVPSNDYFHSVEAINVDTGYPEVVLFDNRNLAIQWHPEWAMVGPFSQAQDYWKELLNSIME